MKTNAQHQAEFKAKQREKSLVRLGIDWVTEQQKSDIKLYLSGKATIVKGGSMTNKSIKKGCILDVSPEGESGFRACVLELLSENCVRVVDLDSGKTSIRCCVVECDDPVIDDVFSIVKQGE